MPSELDLLHQRKQNGHTVPVPSCDDAKWALSFLNGQRIPMAISQHTVSVRLREANSAQKSHSSVDVGCSQLGAQDPLLVTALWHLRDTKGKGAHSR